MFSKSKPTTIIHEDLMLRIFRGKYDAYRCKSPYYGYKQAHHYDKVVYIYLVGHFDDGYIDTQYYKCRTNKEIIAKMPEFKKSRKYLKAIEGLQGITK